MIGWVLTLGAYAFVGAVILFGTGLWEPKSDYEWWQYVAAIAVGWAAISGAMYAFGRRERRPSSQ
jgi:hypothetical protein